MATQKFYVYTLTDPRDLKVFYVGKGTASRGYAHTHRLDIRDTDASPKARRVRDIIDSGEEVVVNILKRFVDEDEAYEYEASLIEKTPDLENSLAGGGGDRSEMTKAADGKRYKLTPKQEQFAQLVASAEHTLSDCYRAAYDTSRMNDKQVNEEASKLGSHPKITQRVEVIKAPIIEKTQLKLHDIITGLQRAADLADQTAQAGAMVSAFRELGKIADLYPAERKEITMTDDIVDRLQAGRKRAANVVDIAAHRKEG
tara:strand:+ start:2300 stop:3070 length:771 start_codon:yes stop_codon:yes gene_type:complete